MTARRFRKLLIANRGEIACRIVRTARAMGYRTVAVFSDADAAAMHTPAADEAVRIGPPPPRESYLDIARFIDAAKKTGADAIHPGYGFLAENADFAEACEATGIVFVGPPASVIRAMGDKAAAKAIAEAAGLPCVPGYRGEDQADARLTAEAAAVGFPLLVKAVAGGGGRGIRAVHAAAELHEALAAARREAKAAFGDDRLMLERLIERPRHLEVQIFGDDRGNVVHLFERDCSTQRRRQKIIEEAPSPVLTPAHRERLTGYAVALAQAAGYRNAGTVEFISDADLNFYFLEMNTRLQVEHPVTEMVVGVDLVDWQLRVAAGEPLPLRQDEIAMRGHAIEARLCAEDPYDGFRPQTGTVAHFAPQESGGVRFDSGVETGSEVSPWYDSMVAKAIASGQDRAEAARRLASALEDAPLLGLATNREFLIALLRGEAFERAEIATTTLDDWAQTGAGDAASPFARPRPSPTDWALAAALSAERGGSAGEWFWSGSACDFSLDLTCGGETKRLTYTRPRSGPLAVAVGSERIEIALIENAPPRILFEANGVRRRATAAWQGATLHLAIDGAAFTFAEPDHAHADDAADGARIAAPVAGLLVKVLAEPGQAVAAGDTLAIIEAMKMETRVTALAAGRVAAVHASAGAQVASGALLFEIETEDAPADVR
ncbi:carbamoyl-phosphate synthase subunit L [Rhodomicrobium udaipurense JA643]|uniref:Biotin/lipoyl-binding protein n=1 Tax=Rhodomicrobium udaipurense TaxID=1202716 RepID=A0A8I1GHN1_9HYPH|nr:biotin carboxylase N-terminal domain-containing protein [Rhodomicrobium udaipurense]KAI94561.1 carbamoyl-phosphate synthase subunit L [Rhodomicrobium udaipurense JA643]MBJ7545078.1 biotin/lipoyl-binding protein [Rhodomicrobium udaipurense]